MGQVTRTQFGCSKAIRLTNAQVIALPTTPFDIVAPRAGWQFVALAAMVRLNWTADYTNIDGDAEFSINELPPLIEGASGDTKVSDLLADASTKIALFRAVGPIVADTTVGQGPPVTVSVEISRLTDADFDTADF